MRTLYVMTAILLVLTLAGGGHVLVRIDRARAQAELATARTRYLELQLAVLGRHVRERDVKPDNAAHLEIAEKRIEVLRRVVWTLVERGVHWSGTTTMPSLHDAHWPEMPTPGWDLRCERMRVVGGEPR
jgi:hypothetical protein